MEDRCRKAVRLVVTPKSSCHLISLSDFKKMGGLKPHELARDAGLLITLDNYDDLTSFASQHKLIFFSHRTPHARHLTSPIRPPTLG